MRYIYIYVPYIWSYKVLLPNKFYVYFNRACLRASTVEKECLQKCFYIYSNFAFAFGSQKGLFRFHIQISYWRFPMLILCINPNQNFSTPSNLIPRANLRDGLHDAGGLAYMT